MPSTTAKRTNEALWSAAKRATIEKIATDRAKNLGTKQGTQWVKQPARIAKKTAKYRKTS